MIQLRTTGDGEGLVDLSEFSDQALRDKTTDLFIILDDQGGGSKGDTL